MSNEMIVYEAIGSDAAQAVSFVEKVGTLMRGGLKGCKTPGESTVAALQMLTERLSPAQFQSKYHMLDGGGMELQAVWMLAELERLGYLPVWVDNGESGEKATLQITKDGKPLQMTFTLEMAKKKGIVKKGSTWDVDPALMLRARATGRLVDAYVPSVRVGCPDVGDDDNATESPEMESNGKRPRTRTPKAAASGPASPAAGSSESAAAGHAPAGETTASAPSVASGKPAEDAEFSPKGMSESVRLAVLLTDLRQQHGDSHPDVAVCRSQLLAARIQSEREGGELIPDSEIAEVQNLVAAVKHTDLYKIAVPLLTRYIGPEKHIAEMTPTAGKWLLIHLYLAALKFSKETIAAALAKCGAGEVEDLNRAHATAFVDSLRKRYATPAAA